MDAAWIVLGTLAASVTYATTGVLMMFGVWKLAELWDARDGIHGDVTREDVR